MRQRKFGFTLAEVMIVLSVIGILSAILMPIAFKSSPDKNIMKFKKAHNTLHNAVRELVSSDKYYTHNYLGYSIASLENGHSGSLPNDFCRNLSDVISIKDNSCTIEVQDQEPLGVAYEAMVYDTIRGRWDMVAEDVDAFCIKIQSVQQSLGANIINYIITSDNVLFYDGPIDIHPGIISNPASYDCNADGPQSGSGAKLGQDPKGDYICVDKYGFNPFYGTYCIDVDGLDGPVKPFGYAIRADGKIVSGARANWWLERDITKKENECCPKALQTSSSATYSSSLAGYDLCDEGDTVCTE